MALKPTFCTASFFLSFLFSAYIRFTIRLHSQVDKPQQPTYTPDANSPALFAGPKVLPTLRDIEDMSSVDYMACCGAGHRLSKMADAHYVANHLNFSLRGYWGYCDEVEVFHFLFGPQPISELVHITEYNHYARIHNDVPGFIKLQRHGSGEECQCSKKKIALDVEFYESLRQRFSAREAVDDFVRQHFTKNVTSVGVHIRAGNGENGDFAERGRTIMNEEKWLNNLAARIKSLDLRATVLFVATDTPLMIRRLEELLNDSVKVVFWEQNHPSEGSGVLFGEMGKVLRKGAECLSGWENSIVDMMILSHADIIVSARPSSFTQSLPMSLLFSKTNKKKNRAFCELTLDARQIRCYHSIDEWCCQGETSFSLEGIQRYEYLRMPIKAFDTIDFNIKVRDDNDCIPRPEGNRQICLPYDFSDYRGSTRKRQSVLLQPGHNRNKQRRRHGGVPHP